MCEIATATHVWAPPAAVFYRKSLVDRIGGFNVRLPVIQDARFLFDAAFHGARFCHFATWARAIASTGSLSRANPAGSPPTSWSTPWKSRTAAQPRALTGKQKQVPM